MMSFTCHVNRQNARMLELNNSRIHGAVSHVMIKRIENAYTRGTESTCSILINNNNNNIRYKVNLGSFPVGGAGQWLGGALARFRDVVLGLSITERWWLVGFSLVRALCQIPWIGRQSGSGWLGATFRRTLRNCY
jgi:hypothetical protein